MVEDNDDKKTRLDWIDIDKIKYNPKNPRQRFTQGSIDKLAKSIKKEGILVPLLVYKENDDVYILLDGERRLRAARKINEKSVPVNVIIKPNDKDNILKMFEIHTQREDWDPVSIAWSVQNLIEVLNINKTPEEILDDSNQLKTLQKKVGLKKGKLIESLIILTYPHDLQKRVFEKKLKPAYLIEMFPLLEAYRDNQNEIYSKIGHEKIIGILIEKIDVKVIKNATKFRKMKDVVTAGKIGVSEKLVKKLSNDFLLNIEMKIEDAYNTIEEAHNKTFKDTYKIDEIISKCKDLEHDLSEIQNITFVEREKLTKHLKKLELIMSKIIRHEDGD